MSFELAIEVSEQYPFHKDSLNRIEQNPWVKNQWPLVYFIRNDNIKVAYVGESTNALSRIKNHLGNPQRCKLDTISIIGSDKFNKSATLDIESKLIQYIIAEGAYKLQNGNYGLINHNYYQQDLYKNLFKEVWNKLIERRIVTKSLAEIENSELFKYSPYKALNQDQYDSVLEILEGLTSKKYSRIFISGSAGTGKTILATYLIKLLNTNSDELQTDDFNEDELKEIEFVKNFRAKYPNAKIGLVVAMTSLRESLEHVFRMIPGLKPSMVINPSDTFKLREKYDLLVVDEAHRLRKYKNISWMGAFKKNNEKLGLDDTGTELDWIIANSKNQIFFYDSAQSVKPSDVDSERFNLLLNDDNSVCLELKSQMRVKGGNNYIQFVDDLLQVNRVEKDRYQDDKYELLFFDDFNVLRRELIKKENEFGLCRMIAGYSWPWVSNPKLNPTPHSGTTDIDLDGLSFKWNSTDKDWINSANAFNEVGCIHTTQGYDLNYAAVIFGKEIDYDKKSNTILIYPEKYFDLNGKKGVPDINVLKSYIINIYKTIMYRGIKGTYVYASNQGLRDYLKDHIVTYKNEFPFRILSDQDIKPYINCIPLIDISAAAGKFSDLQSHSELTWIEPPFSISAKKGYFVCKVVGESMNKIIPNGSYCLFKQDEGGSRNGKIVLVQSTSIKDPAFGSGYTVKEYNSKKVISDEGWKHESIVLKPLSTMDEYENIELSEDDLLNFKVVGVFDRVIA
ncbi:DNA/RNA helicase domain-containing protein [Sediminibacterium goheungense]|nr:DNA/RNA helicase domain-containing protein [Sediminibacterium goheungense]